MEHNHRGSEPTAWPCPACAEYGHNHGAWCPKCDEREARLAALSAAVRELRQTCPVQACEGDWAKLLAALAASAGTP
jgi:hypothetical protein